MEVVVFKSKRSILGKLTRIFTDSYSYHIGFIDENKDIYEVMIQGLRVRKFEEVDKHTSLIIYDVNADIDKEEIINEILAQKLTYGFIDYLLFGAAKIQFLAKYLWNGKGIICSEWVNIHLKHSGMETPFDLNDHPPSPADLERFFIKKGITGKVIKK